MAECLGSLFRGYLGIVSQISGAPRLNRGLKYAPKPLRHQYSGPDQSQKKAYNLLDEIFAHVIIKIIQTRSDNVICGSAHQIKALELTNSTIRSLGQSTYQGALELIVNYIP